MWGSSSVGGRARVRMAFRKHGRARTAGLARGTSATGRSPATLGVGTAPSPSHPNAPRVWGAPPHAWLEENKENWANGKALCCVLPRALRQTGSLQESNSRTWMRGAALVALLLWWVWVGESIGLYTRPPLPPLHPWQPSTAGTSP